MRAKWGEDKWVESENPLCDFYGGVFTMSYYAGDTIFRFDETTQDFTPEYILSFAEKPTFEMSHQWGKTDTRFFDYYFPYDYVISKDYFYLFLGHKDKSFIARFSKKMERWIMLHLRMKLLLVSLQMDLHIGEWI